MNQQQSSTITTLRAIEAFIDAQPALAPLKTTTTRQNLDAAVAALNSFSTDQSGGRQSAKVETVAQRSLRLALRQQHMAAIAHAAKQTLATSSDLPELSMPKGKLNVQALLAYAAGMRQAAAKHEQALIAGGCPPDFLAGLDAAAKALSDSLVDRAQQTNQAKAATAGLKLAEKQAMTAIRVLNTQVLRLLGKNTALVAAWKLIKKVQKKPGLPRGALAAAAAADAATQAAAHPGGSTTTPALAPAPTPTTPAAPTSTQGATTPTA